MAKVKSSKSWLVRTRQKNAFRSGFHAGSGLKNRTIVDRLIAGRDEKAAQDMGNTKKFYDAGKKAAAMVAAGAVTVDQAFELAENRIDGEAVELEGDVLAAVRAEVLEENADAEAGGEALEEAHSEEAEVEEIQALDDVEVDQEESDTDYSAEVEDPGEEADIVDSADTDSAEMDEADLDEAMSDEADEDDADEE